MTATLIAYAILALLITFFFGIAVGELLERRRHESRRKGFIVG